jgi:hypothetical protein
LNLLYNVARRLGTPDFQNIEPKKTYLVIWMFDYIKIKLKNLLVNFGGIYLLPYLKILVYRKKSRFFLSQKEIIRAFK